jgi:hypothetical protein
MFASGIIPNTDLSIELNGGHMNGPILKVRGALFLARFIGELILKYNSLCEES